jgi:hypothetical protein
MVLANPMHTCTQARGTSKKVPPKKKNFLNACKTSSIPEICLPICLSQVSCFKSPLMCTHSITRSTLLRAHKGTHKRIYTFTHTDRQTDRHICTRLQALDVSKKACYTEAGVGTYSLTECTHTASLSHVQTLTHSYGHIQPH